MMNSPALDPSDVTVVNHIVKLLSETTMPDNTVRAAAENSLRNIESLVDRQRGFVCVLLAIACSPTVDSVVRMAAAVYLKNVVKHCWNPEDAEHALQENDKVFIRSHVFDAMIASTEGLQATFSKAVFHICEVDFPDRWPDIVNLIAARLRKGNSCTVIVAALSCAHSIFQRYQAVPTLTEKLKTELLAINAIFTQPMLEAMVSLCEIASSNVQECKLAVQGLTFACNVLFDLTYLDMGDEHEAAMASLMNFLLRCLHLQAANPKAVGGTEFEPGPLQQLVSSALACVTLHLQQYDEEFAPYVQQFIATVWDVLCSPYNRCPAGDQVVMEAMDFVGTVARSEHHPLLQDAIQTLCETIVVPNIHLSDQDLEIFEEEPFQYIQREIEGSDVNTRRRSACELVRSLMVRFEAQITPFLQQSANALLSSTDWRSRDSGIFLVTAMSVKGGAMSFQRSGSIVLSDVFPIAEFYDSTIVPELQQHAAQNPILKADAMRFVAIFREFIPASGIPTLLQQLAMWLEAPHVVLHAYAAHTIEKLLLVHDHGTPRIALQSHPDLAPLILGGLCRRIASDQTPNEYVMHALMRVVQMDDATKGITKPYVGHIIPVIGQTLSRAAKNPSNPKFNHYMFEVIAFCIKLCPEHGPAIENVLWPTLMFILTEDVNAFLPYALQILAQLLDTRGGAADVPDQYLQLFAPLVAPQIFSQRGNIPAIVRLLCSFVAKCPQRIIAMGMTEKTLGVFQYLITMKRHDHEGFNLLVAVVMHFPSEAIDQHLTTVLTLILTQHQMSPSPKFSRCAAVFFSVLTVLRGAQFFVDVLNRLQPGLSEMVLGRLWLTSAMKIIGHTERKACIVALTMLVALPFPNSDLLANSIFMILKMLHSGTERDEDDTKAPNGTWSNTQSQFDEPMGDISVYCPLRGAALPHEDPCTSVTNVPEFFTQQLAALFRGPRGASIRSQLQTKLPPELVGYLPPG